MQYPPSLTLRLASAALVTTLAAGCGSIGEDAEAVAVPSDDDSEVAQVVALALQEFRGQAEAIALVEEGLAGMDAQPTLEATCHPDEELLTSSLYPFEQARAPLAFSRTALEQALAPTQLSLVRTSELPTTGSDWSGFYEAQSTRVILRLYGPQAVPRGVAIYLQEHPGETGMAQGAAGYFYEWDGDRWTLRETFCSWVG